MDKQSPLLRLWLIVYIPLVYFARLLLESWEDLGLCEIILDLSATLMSIIFGILFGFTHSADKRELYHLAFWYSLSFLMASIIFRVFVITPYKTIKNQDEQIAEYRERLRPKFQLSCRRDMVSCHVPSINGQWDIRRVQVVADCDSAIKNCRGHLIKIEKDGKTVFGHDTLVLPFAKSEEPDSLSKTLNPHIPEHLDVLCWFKPGFFVHFATKEPVVALDHKREYVFKEEGTYILTVAVTGDNGGPPETIKLKFVWEQPYDNAYMEKL